MAFNIDTFKTRALTALVFVAVMLFGLLYNFRYFLALFTIVHFGCWYELVKLMKKIYGEKYLRYCVLGLIYITLPIVALIYLGLKLNYSQPNLDGAHFANLFWLGIGFSPLLPCIVIFSIWINDTMAYVVGSFIGKTPFSKISPKKTWEGTIGGAVLCVAVMTFLAIIFNTGGWLGKNYLMQIAIIASICAVFGTIGDLFESKLKRLANVKDSGSIMPGHGGFLDRFDSLLFAAPIVWVYVYFFVS
jgi:phosphatidate cytidylyltransferase